MNKLTFLTTSVGLFDDNRLTANNQDLQLALSKFARQPTMSVFDTRIFTFIQDLSAHLLKQPEFRQFPELIALGFWLRQANLHKKIQKGMVKQWPSTRAEHSNDNKMTDGKLDSFQDKVNSLSQLNRAIGCVVHFTPANVDTMFIYSWVASLLMGNLNIVRVASQDSQSKVELLSLINHLFSQTAHQEIAKRNVFASYDKTSEMTPMLCAVADARLMWGGDASVAQIQSFSGKMNCRDFCFSDKYSIAIMNANTLNADTSLVAQNLWRDTQPFQQQACSSPRVLYVLDENSDKINESLVALFKQLNGLAEQAKDDWKTLGRTNEHLVSMQNIALMGDSTESNAVLYLSRVSAVNISKLSSSLLELHDGNGLFFVRICQSLQQIVTELSVCLPEKLQTITTNGVEESIVENTVTQLLPQAHFRVQALGQALDFDFKWDGYDLLSSLCQVQDLPQA
jgi:hypothetical protein